MAGAMSGLQAQGLVSTLAVRRSSRWRGFRSRERANSGGPVSSPCASCVSWVSSAENLRSAASKRAKKASLRVRSVKSREFHGAERSPSGFWGSELEGKRLQLRGTRRLGSETQPRVVEARLFGPAIFQAAKLRVLTLGRESKKGASEVVEPPRVYTVTHSDITAQLTLAIAEEINKTQFMGWYSRLQRDEVLAEWRKTQGVLSLHVHCHISGGNWLHCMIAKLRFFIFQKELPMVLEAIMHGDHRLFKNFPELEAAPVYVYFHSNLEEYNRLEYWGPLVEATKRSPQMTTDELRGQSLVDGVCLQDCECCSRHATVRPIPESLQRFFRLQDSRKQQQEEL
ncbi:hypothetical protein R1flu_018969 [Riccia fluitans]|uniref:Staygreen protein domain-containing protein n=1 Tax=Riccia fluitans TaxID=41844 RepID=A0ABD1ZJL0_9MARC